MTARVRLRLVAIVPALFAVGGVEIVRLCLQARAFVSPTRGVIVGIGVIAVAAIAVVQLWRATRSSPILVLASGVYLFVAVGMLPWLLGIADMVNATGGDEALSFIAVHGYEIAMAAFAILTVGAALVARGAFRTEA
jgi:hypothetical protein